MNALGYRPIFTSFASLLAAVIGVALPLEYLPELPGVLHYASVPQSIQIFAELGAVFLVLGAAFGVACMAVGPIFALIARRAVKGSIVDALSLGYALTLGLSMLEGLRAWLHAIGVTPHLLNWMRDQHWLPRGVTDHRMGLWLTMGMIGSVVAWARWRRSKGGAAPVQTPQAIRFWCGLSGLMIFCGLATAPVWPLMDNREPEEVAQQAPRTQPDVLLLTVDTLSADHLSLYGYHLPTTPALDRFAKTASVFEHFYANSNVTTPSMASVLLGERPWRHRVFVAPSAPLESHARRSLLATFHKAGYRTITVSTNPFASPPKLQTMPDVDTHDVSNPWREKCPHDPDVLAQYLMHQQSIAILDTNTIWQTSRFLLLSWLIDAGICPATDHFDPRAALHQTETRWREAEGKPAFVWVHLTPPHDPYAPPPPYVGMFDQGGQARTILDSSPVYHYLGHTLAAKQRKELLPRYDESIRYVDAAIGDFLENLDKTGMLANTVVVISADHGENFWHDYGGHGGPELYDEVTRLPLLIRKPGQQGEQRVALPAEQADLLPTIADLANVPLLGEVEGRSFANALAGQSVKPRPIYSMNFERSQKEGALEQGSVMTVDYPWKLTTRIGPMDATTPHGQRDRLYRLDNDPREQQDLVAAHPEVAARLRAAIESEVEKNKALLP